MRIASHFLATVILPSCSSPKTSPSRTITYADYADADPVSFSREARAFSPAEGVYIYDLVADADGFVLLADWTDTDREPPSVQGLLRLDPATGAVDDVDDALELGSPSGGGRLARTDGPLVALVDSPVAGNYAAIFTLDGGVEAHYTIPLEAVFAAAASEGLLYVAGLDRVPCDDWSDWCPRLWAWDLETGASSELDYPDVGQAIALQPAAGGVELLSAEVFGRYDQAADSWETTPLPEPLGGFTTLSETERLFFRYESSDESQPVVYDLATATWREGNFDATPAPVRLSAEYEGQTWVLDGHAAEEGFVPTLSVVAER